MKDAQVVIVRQLTAETFQPYGWLLGKPLGDAEVAFANEATDFRSEHVFGVGEGGLPEVLWVRYRNRTMLIADLEVHHLTQQAIVPLDGDVVHIVATSDANGEPDLTSLAAFLVPNGAGVCMRPGCWHATRVRNADVTCLMLTRQSTTLDLIAHLNAERQAAESAMRRIHPFHVTFAD